MRTTLDLDEDLLKEAMEAAHARTKTAAVHAGLKALVEQAARRRLAALFGTMPEADAPRRRRGVASAQRKP
jgi:Arc/MetJ family transcription regulator